MATKLWQCSRDFRILPLVIQTSFVPVRNKTHGNLPQKRRINPFVKRHTDFIKHLCIALVKYERIQTTYERARKLEKYGNMLIEFTKRKQPPPDLFMIENGFLLRPDEAVAKLTHKRIVNRKWKKRVLYPKPLSEEEFVAHCRIEATNVLLGDQEALNKLYGELADRYKDTYGGYVKFTRVPNQPNKPYPWLAYVEFQGNGLPELPVMPDIVLGRIKGNPREFLPHELTHLIQEVD